MPRIIYHSADGVVHADFPIEELSSVINDQQGLVWVDLDEVPVHQCVPILADVFGFHPLAVDDALDESHIPKIDDWGDYVYLVLHEVIFHSNDSKTVDTLELDLFLGRNYIVTYQAKSIAAVDRVWQSCLRDQRSFKKGASYLLYRIADEIAADYMPVVERIDEIIDVIEDGVFKAPQQSLLEQIFILKRTILHLRRIIAPQREVLNKLARGDYAVVDRDDRVFFRDVYDHLVRLHDIVDGLRDLIGGVLDTYLSVVNNRMNEVMKILTIITTLFMPIAFLTGFFGMNFFEPTESLPAWTGMPAFAALLFLIISLPIGMFVWMRYRAWTA